MTDLLLAAANKRLKFYAADMKEYPPGKWYETPVFRMHKLFNLFARVFPNGYSQDYSGDVCLQIFLDKMPTHFAKIRFRYQMKFKKNGIDKISSATREFKSSGNSFTEYRFCTSKEFFGESESSGWSYIDFSVQILTLQDAQGKEIGFEEHKTSERSEKGTSESGTSSSGSSLSESSENRIKSIETRLDEISKTLESFKKDIVLLKETCRLFSNDQDGIKQWLTSQVQLPQYYDTFIKNGIDDINVAKLITMDILKEIGVEIIGHRMRILHGVKVLNQK